MAEVKPIILKDNKIKEITILDTVPQVYVTNLVANLEEIRDDIIALAIAL